MSYSVIYKQGFKAGKAYAKNAISQGQNLDEAYKTGVESIASHPDDYKHGWEVAFNGVVKMGGKVSAPQAVMSSTNAPAAKAAARSSRESERSRWPSSPPSPSMPSKSTGAVGAELGTPRA